MPRACSFARISVPERGDRTEAVAQLSAVVTAARRSPFAEIWIEQDGGYPALCALISGDRGWLMYLRFEGDAGFSSRNPAFQARLDETIEYVLGNGEVDRYPASWAMPVDQVFESLTTFASTGTMPGWLTWFNDSRDGTPRP